MPNATRLCEAGVRFSKVGNTYSDLRDSTTLFDIKFENEQMKTPGFKVDDYMETLLRNLIAYEQQPYDVRPKCFSDFAVFMGYLIDSDKDVNLLGQKGIISHQLGEDREVANIFNRIGQGITIATDFYCKDECTKAIQHFEKPWNRMKAELRRKYFATAFVILLLTVAQTIISFISLFK